MDFYGSNLGGRYLDYVGCNTIEDVLDKYKKEIKLSVIDCIDISFNQEIDEMIVFLIRDPMQPEIIYEIRVDRGSWHSALDSCKDYFESIEDYEECSHIKDLQHRISTDFSGHPE